MTDTVTKKQRSNVMRSVKSKGNKSTELKLIDYFKTYHITGWRRNYKIVGKPDFVFPKLKIALFADGCFWHGHDCRNLTPSDNSEYWERKIARNKKRDTFVTDTLHKKGWKVVRIWECEIKKSNFQKLESVGLLPSKQTRKNT